MSVTESKVKTERKSSRKPAKTQETVLSALLAETAEVSVPLASLIKSPLNVRTVPYSAESVSELAESIKGVGLLQNLVVHTLPGDRYGVAAGGCKMASESIMVWHLNRSRFGIRIDHDLASISDHSLASQSITIWHASDH